MLFGNGNENGQKTIARAALFFVHFYDVVLHDYNGRLHTRDG